MNYVFPARILSKTSSPVLFSEQQQANICFPSSSFLLLSFFHFFFFQSNNWLDRHTFWNNLILDPHVNRNKYIIGCCDCTKNQTSEKHQWICRFLHILNLWTKLQWRLKYFRNMNMNIIRASEKEHLINAHNRNAFCIVCTQVLVLCYPTLVVLDTKSSGKLCKQPPMSRTKIHH